MRVALVILLAIAASAATYLWLERLGRRGLVPLVCRTVAWAALGLLLVNVSCPVPTAVRRPIALLDASLSLGAAGGHWAEARAAAARLGEVRTFGDERGGVAGAADSVPDRGRSLLAPALAAALAGDRPVVVVTDGEIEDAPDLPADLMAAAGVQLFPRTPASDLAITRVQGPARVTAGDSIALEIDVRAVGPNAPDSVGVEVRAGQDRLAGRRMALAGGAGRLRLQVPSARLGAGDHLLRVALPGGDAEPRTDERLHLVTVAATPGVVLVAAPGDWDSRFLYRAVREVADLPVRGYVRLDGERWRSMATLAPVPSDEVRQAVRRANLLIVKGDGRPAQGAGPRGLLLWPSGENGEAVVAGDWYLSAAEASPLSGAFLGAPLDSFPPVTQISPVQPGEGDWVALTAQEGRRGAQRPVVIGRTEGRQRRVTVAADGLWRWAFRGGSSEQAYRAWVGATVSWLLGGADSTRGSARAVRPVVANARPVVFEWLGEGPAAPLGITWTGDGAPAADTLRFDGDGRASVWLPVGEYRYRLAGGGGGTVAVERYSDELLPGPVALTERAPRGSRPAERSAARDWLWLFGLAVLGFAAEWLARRRLGLR
jgi:hypothetical protein